MGRDGEGESARVDRKEGGGEGEHGSGQQGGGDGEGGNGKGEGRRKGKRRGDFTDGCDGILE